VRRRFVLTPEAAANLREILLGIADDRPKTAERVRTEFLSCFQRLGRSPGIGHYREDLLDRHFRFTTFYSWVICYAWEPKPIQIIAVVHGARQLAAFFSSRLD
jgi:plasmid stabilization system protein ParE